MSFRLKRLTILMLEAGLVSTELVDSFGMVWLSGDHTYFVGGAQ